MVVIAPGVAGVEGIGRAGGQARESGDSLPMVRLNLDVGCVAVLKVTLSGRAERGKSDAAAGSLDYRRCIGRFLGCLGSRSGDVRGGAYGVPCAVSAGSLDIAYGDRNIRPCISTVICSRAGHGDFIFAVHKVVAGHDQFDIRIGIAVIDFGNCICDGCRDGLGIQRDGHGGRAAVQVVAAAVLHGETMTAYRYTLLGCVVGNSERTICDLCHSELGITQVQSYLVLLRFGNAVDSVAGSLVGGGNLAADGDGVAVVKGVSLRRTVV